METSQAPAAPLGEITAADVTAVRSIVLDRLRAAILDGSLAPGQRLLQEELAAQLRVSRQPVREALRQLESEGLVERMADRSTIVRRYSLEDVRENYFLRGVLESESAGLAAQRITEAQIVELTELQEDMATAVRRGRAGSIVEINQRFHLLITEAAGMPTLSRLVSLLWVGHTVLTPLLLPDRPGRSLTEHGRILDAIVARDPAGARTAMRAHIEAAAEEYLHSDNPVFDG